jgi:ribosomal protein S17E
MTPTEFMTFATPVILLISSEIRSYLVKRELREITERQTNAINAAGQDRVRQIESTTLNAASKVVSTTLDAASKVAIHTSNQATALADELTTIHEIVNGNTTALKNRIAELETQLAARNKP